MMKLRYFPELREAIAEYFNEEELRNFVYEMAIDYDHLRGATTQGKAQALVDYCEKRGSIELLVATLETTRSHIKWQEKARPREQPVPKDLVQTTQETAFKKFTLALSKDCGDMKIKPDTYNDIPTLLYRCFEYWESLHRDLKLHRNDLSSTLIEDPNTIKDGRYLLKLVASNCLSLRQTLENENINPSGLRPNSHVCEDLQTIRWHIEQVLLVLDMLEEKLYADEDIDDETYAIREEISVIESMIADVTSWLWAVIQILDVPEEPQKSESAEYY